MFPRSREKMKLIRWYSKKMYEGLQKPDGIAHLREPQQVDLHVAADSDNVYSVAESDLTALDQILFPTEGFRFFLQ